MNVRQIVFEDLDKVVVRMADDLRPRGSASAPVRKPASV